jgi:hypothetical protein
MVAILQNNDAICSGHSEIQERTTISIGMKIACFWFQGISFWRWLFFLRMKVTYFYAIPWVGENQ